MSRVALGAVAALVYAFLYLPLIVVIIYAFNSATITSWPPGQPSLHWFNVLWNDPDPRDAIANSLKVAVTATLLAVLLGTPAAFALQRFRFFGKESLGFVITLPILLPGIITGIAMLTWFTQLIQWGVLPGLSLLTVTIGHATFCIVLVFNNVLARLRRATPALGEASMDLGAGRLANVLEGDTSQHSRRPDCGRASRFHAVVRRNNRDLFSHRSAEHVASLDSWAYQTGHELSGNRRRGSGHHRCIDSHRPSRSVPDQRGGAIG